MKIVLRIGGSVFGSPPNAELVSLYKAVVSNLLKKHHEVALVVGGGDVARRYIDSAKALGLSRREQDLVAIQASRLNAELVGMSLGVAPIATTIYGMVASLARNRVAVMGGLRPGITTDTVASLLAEAWHGDLLIKASDQEGIYTADPRLNADAKLLRKMTYERLTDLLGGRHSPGIHSIVDPVAVERIARLKLRLVVLDGRKPMNVLKVVDGEAVGSTVS